MKIQKTDAVTVKIQKQTKQCPREKKDRRTDNDLQYQTKE